MLDDNFVRQNTKDKVGKILGAISEAHREEAAAFVRRFNQEIRVPIAEILVDAYVAKKYDEAKRELGKFVKTGILTEDIVNIYRTLKLKSTQPESS